MAWPRAGLDAALCTHIVPDFIGRPAGGCSNLFEAAASSINYALNQLGYQHGLLHLAQVEEVFHLPFWAITLSMALD